MNYEEMNELQYCEKVREYASVLASLADGWTVEEIRRELDWADSMGDEFLESMTSEQMDEFAWSVMMEIEG